MNYTYQIMESGIVFRVEDGACIPADNLNTDYINYLKWVDDGNTAAPYVEPENEVGPENEPEGE